MKNPIAAAGLIFFNLFFINAQAQVKLTPMQVKEILIRNSYGGIGYRSAVDVKVMAEAGKWHSYVTDQAGYTNRPEPKSYDKPSHQFIAEVNPALLNNLLEGIAVIKPAITPSTFGFTPQKLIAELKNDAKLPITDAPDFEKLITQKAIDDAIAGTVRDFDLVDTFEDTEMDIITRDNDTVKLITRNACPTKQPWTINEHTTYDMAINNFILAAIGNQYMFNNEALNINSLKESIYQCIDAYKADGPIITFKWKHDYPANLKLLTETFKIKKISLYGGDVYSCLLRTKAMPANAYIESEINMAHPSDVKTVIEYAGLIDRYFKGDNFVFNYYRNRRDSKISFFYDSRISPYESLRYIDKKLPELGSPDSTQVIHFCITAPVDGVSIWSIFPDNKTLLTNYVAIAPRAKSAPFFPLPDPKADWITKNHTYYLFDGTGKMLSQGPGF